jgi:hypothetical protein
MTGVPVNLATSIAKGVLMKIDPLAPVSVRAEREIP